MLHLHPEMASDLQDIHVTLKGVFQLLVVLRMILKPYNFVWISANILLCGTPKVRWKIKNKHPF